MEITALSLHSLTLYTIVRTKSLQWFEKAWRICHSRNRPYRDKRRYIHIYTHRHTMGGCSLSAYPNPRLMVQRMDRRDSAAVPDRSSFCDRIFRIGP